MVKTIRQKLEHEYLSERNFVQNPADHCVCTKVAGNKKVKVFIVRVDDLIIAASDKVNQLV